MTVGADIVRHADAAGRGVRRGVRHAIDSRVMRAGGAPSAPRQPSDQGVRMFIPFHPPAASRAARGVN